MDTEKKSLIFLLYHPYAVRILVRLHKDPVGLGLSRNRGWTILLGIKKTIGLSKNN